MASQPGVLVPAHGVYAGRLRIEGEDVDRWAVTNIGVRPTVSDGERVSVESYILDYSGNLYGRRVHLELLDFLRPERKFADTEALKAQITRDTAAVRAFMAEN
jgi:riboflavin kinase/FMN adenylyltransferase